MGGRHTLFAGVHDSLESGSLPRKNAATIAILGCHRRRASLASAILDDDERTGPHPDALHRKRINACGPGWRFAYRGDEVTRGFR
jgi:hypothetical protein